MSAHRAAPGAAGLALLATVVAAAHVQAQADETPPAIATAYPLSREHAPGDRFEGVRLLGALKLSAVTFRGQRLGGLSALAFDRDEGLLYALSDRGALFHLALDFDREGLLADARLRGAVALRDERGKPLAGARADAEGMALRHGDNGVRGDSELAVAFERVPRVLRFTPEGRVLGKVALPPRLGETSHYRSGNRSLESLAWHPSHGYLTANEQPFTDTTDGEVEVHAIPPAEPQRWWRYPLAIEPNAALTDLAVLADGSLLTLERGYGFLYVPFITTLRHVASLPDAPGALLEAHTVLRLNTGQGWALDNFEGLAVLPGGRLVMVSDDNTRAVQATLLAAFELVDTTSDGPARRGGNR